EALGPVEVGDEEHGMVETHRRKAHREVLSRDEMPARAAAEPGPGGRMGRRSAGVVGADGGHLELEGHLLADEHTAGLEGGVPVDAPVLAVDDRLAFEADAVVP